MERVCVLDLGTNSLLTLVAESGKSGIVPLYQRLILVRLGRSLHLDGLIPEEAVEEAASAVMRCRRDAASYGVGRWILVGTQAFRIAYNGSEAANRIREITGLPVEVLTPEEEALWSFRGALGKSSPDGQVGVLDIGGGSTEIAVGRERLLESFSIPVGALVGTGKWLRHDPPAREEIDALIREIEQSLDPIRLKTKPDRWIGVGGTVTTLAAVNLGLRRYSPERIEGTILSLLDVNHWFQVWLYQTAAQRRDSIKVDPSRAEIILGGTAILGTWMRRFGVDALTVSDGGLRFGIASRELSRV